MAYRDVLLGSAACHVGEDASAECNGWFNGAVSKHPEYGRGGIGLGDAWCATYVCWVAEQASLLNGVVPGVIPFECGVTHMQGLYAQTGGMNGPFSRFKPRGSNYTPKPGDLFFLGEEVETHVGFVKEYLGNGNFSTYEGNATDGNGDTRRLVRIRNRSINDPGFQGFGCNEVPYATLQGHLDEVTATRISGWAYNGVDDDRLRVHIYIYRGTRQIDFFQVTASSFRQDLKNAGKGDGKHAFNVDYNFKNRHGSGVYTVRAYLITADQANYPANKELIGSAKSISV